MKKRLQSPPEISDALHALCDAGCMWSVDESGNITWMEGNTQPAPSKEELQAKLDELTELYNKEQLYKNKRISAYPEYDEQLDMLFHLGYEGWKEEIQKIKDQYPKPE